MCIHTGATAVQPVCYITSNDPHTLLPPSRYCHPHTPCSCTAPQILPTCIFNKKDPIVLGVDVVEGIAKIGTPVCVPTKEGIDLGRIASMELNHKAVDTARAGQSVAMKIEGTNTTEQSRLYGRHFDHTDQIVSRITRESIDALKEHFRDDMGKEDWRLVIKLKKTFGIN
jgi:translation initiation factor 5B